jgi:two-component system, cell cycle response regulator CpdR
MGRLDGLERGIELVLAFRHETWRAFQRSHKGYISLACAALHCPQDSPLAKDMFARGVSGGRFSPHLYPQSALWEPGAGKSRKSRPMSKILLAEDDGDMRRFLVRALQTAGFDVVSFDNGLSAYQRLREEPFELLLTDIVMPEMDGIELARRAAELDPDIKIMFITGFAAVALNADSTAPKHAKVLSKPIHLRELVNEVQKLLAA